MKKLFDKLQVIPSLKHFIDRPTVAGYTGPQTNFVIIVKEILENAIEAATDINQLPEIYIDIKRVDEEKKLYRFTCLDNGSGIPKDKIEIALCKLATTKGVYWKQTLGAIGFGIKGVLGLSTKLQPQPIITISKYIDEKEYQFYKWRLNYLHEKMDIVERKFTSEFTRAGIASSFIRQRLRHRVLDHGLLLEFYFPNLHYTKAVLDYIRQLHFAHPYSKIGVRLPDRSVVNFKRTVNTLPSPPVEILPPISGASVGDLLQTVKITKARTVRQMLKRHYHGVLNKYLNRISKDSSIKSVLSLHPRNLGYIEAEKVLEALKKFKVPSYKQNVLCPIGEENIRKTIEALYGDRVEFIDVVIRPQKTFSSGPVQVETALAVIKDLSEQVVLRYANRTPLLVHKTKDDLYRLIVNDINWRAYGITEETPVLFLAHIASVRLPFFSAAKASLSLPEDILSEFRLAFQELGQRYSRRLTRKQVRQQKLARSLKIYRYLVALSTEITELADKKLSPDVKSVLEKIVGKELAKEVGA